MVYKALIIEDDELLREMYCLKLQLEGFDVETAPDGREGLAKAQASRHDLILLDNLLPYLTGMEILQKLGGKLKTDNTRVLVLSNKSSDTDIKLSRQLGAEDYLIKSQHTPDAIVVKIKQLLNSANPARTT